ncbi:conserved hypothetical protein [Tenacibaculum dicentrarchi]|uniref:DUF3987 domain-containing protein n=1 Tax=Tenacibaculum dicentrarchi TaxID=669041 RepID=A0ABP1EM09_9FLAO|nr:conserved hypothetical protein [Tenacibaculum dicentrarchi]
MEYQEISDFPYDIFPDRIVKLIQEANEHLNYPVEYFASAILCAISNAIGNSHILKFKEGFNVKCNLFFALVGNAGDVKTHPLNLAFKPISEKEKRTYKEYISLLKEYNSFDLDEKKTKEKPLYVKSLLNDFTPESLIKIHATNGKGVTIVADELFGWINSFGRYSKSSGEQETYLSLWSGNAISVDRKGDEPVRLDNSFVNIIGGVQKKLLPDLAKDNRSNNGFIERMLFAINKKPKPIIWSDKDIDKSLMDDYTHLLNKLMDFSCINDQPEEMVLTSKAKEYLIKWQNTKRVEYFDSEVKTSIQAKYEVYALRFAIILQLIYWGSFGRIKNEIDFFIIQCSIRLTEYYFDNAIKVNSLMNKKDPLTKLNEQQQRIYKGLNTKFRTDEIVALAKLEGIPERTIKDFLSKNINTIFSKIERGLYRKIY